MCRHQYSTPYANITDEAYRAIKEVFLIVRGKANSFLFKDYGDYQAENEQFGVGDGSTKVFQLSKTVSLGGGTYTRVITKPNDDVVISVNGAVTGATVS